MASRHLATSTCETCKFKNVALYQSLMTKLCQTLIITLGIVNQFEKHILQI